MCEEMINEEQLSTKFPTTDTNRTNYGTIRQSTELNIDYTIDGTEQSNGTYVDRETR